MKIITFYLPQYHSIPENDKWWGTGFTEWENLKKAYPLFDGHYQPRVPLNNHYYNLLDVKEIEWQAQLAKDYGVYGWCIYHYWFSGHKLLEKPTELLLNHPEIDINYCICWANESWTKAWVSKSNQFLIKQNNGNREDWISHFYYLLPFFKDKRYIRKDGKPFFVIYRPELFPNIGDMFELWNDLAIKEGLGGLTYSYQTMQTNLPSEDYFQYRIEYQPNYSVYDSTHMKHRFLKRIKWSLVKVFRMINVNLEYISPDKLVIRDYDEVWNGILSRKATDKKSIAGAFVDWDNTPRKHEKGSVIQGFSPEKFEKYLTRQIQNVKESYYNDFLFLFAWNEWTEGGYVEPDEKDGYKRLCAVRNALSRFDEIC